MDFYGAPLTVEVEAGRVPMEAIDTAVRRVLRMKFHTGAVRAALRGSRGCPSKVRHARAARRHRGAPPLNQPSCLSNDGVLPLGSHLKASRSSGPARTMFACSRRLPLPGPFRRARRKGEPDRQRRLDAQRHRSLCPAAGRTHTAYHPAGRPARRARQRGRDHLCQGLRRPRRRAPAPGSTKPRMRRKRPMLRSWCWPARAGPATAGDRRRGQRRDKS